MATYLLTFAELEALLEPNDSEARQRLGLRTAGEDVIALAGFASLVARGFAVADGETARRDTQLAAVLAPIAKPSRWIEIGIASPPNAGVVQLYEAGSTRTQVSALPFGVFAVGEIESSEPFAKLARLMMESLLEGDTAQVGVLLRGSDSTGRLSPEGVAARRLTPGRIEIAVGGNEFSDPTEVSLAGVGEAVEAFLSGVA